MGLFVSGDTARTTCDVTYVANQGFLVEMGETKILFDGLFGGIDGDWCVQPDAVTSSKLVEAESPFDDIDLITISHKHVDHFNEQMTVEHILNNPRGKILCPRQVEEILKRNPRYPEFRDNVVAITPETLQDETVEIAGIKIRVLRLEHSPYMETDPDTGERWNRHADIENLGFVLDVNGYRIFHTGDTNPWNETEYETYALHRSPIHLAFLERLFLFGEGYPGIRNIEKHVRPTRIVFMHVGPGRVERTRAHADAFKDRLPEFHFFEKSMDRMSFEME
jgi:L-ascorbate metabolism protein UlaG (beta-lactamase superfamily)